MRSLCFALCLAVAAGFNIGTPALVAQRRSAPVVAVESWYDAGQRLESANARWSETSKEEPKDEYGGMALGLGAFLFTLLGGLDALKLPTMPGIKEIGGGIEAIQQVAAGGV